MADSFPSSGDIDPKTFPFLLADLHRRGATGSLKVDGPSYQKALYLRGGRVLFGSSNDPRDQLGSILIESGKLSPEQLEEVNAKVGPGNPLAKALADSGFVSQRELGEAARAKVECILSDVIAYTSGSFEFEDGVLPKGAVDLKLSTERVITAGVRRISDRSFVLRHLDSLSVVLVPTADFAARIGELHGDAGELPQQLEPGRTLKEAAARTALDEFEAAKIACALLFLGLVEKAAAPTVGFEMVASPEDSPFFLPAEGSSIDIGQPPQPSPIPEPEPEPLPPAAPMAPRQGIETVMLAPEAAPFVPPLDAPKATTREPASSPPAAAREPGSQPPIRIVEPPRRSPSAAKPVQPLKPTTLRPTKPSREDLAALDALLHSRPVSEAPPAPPERDGAPWQPQFLAKPPRGRAHASAGGGGRRLLVSGALAVLVVAAAGGGYLLYLQMGGAATSVATATPAPVAPSPNSVSASPEAAPIPAASAQTPVLPSPTPTAPAATPAAQASAPAPSPSGRATPAASGSAALVDSRALLQSGRLSDAAQAFAANLRAAPRGSFSVQILVACSDETITKAVQAVPAQELYIVPVRYKGRDCYRLCWGIFDSEARAGSAAHGMPEYFRQGGVTPKVVPTAGLLP